jgi:cytochrome c oxidase cbb3-type subunit III
MSSRNEPPSSHRTAGAVAGLALAIGCLGVFGLTGCEREARRFRDHLPPAKTQPVSLSELRPGGAAPPQQVGPYDDEAWAVAEGQRYFTWFNCHGCHANGGGGMGPALMDDTWIYGHEPANIFATIMEGRPNGMPSFRGRIPDQQAWQIVGYVRSLSGQLRRDVEPGRPDGMTTRPAPQATPPARPVNSK